MPLDLGLHSPLVDLFARGQLPLDMRLLAASNQVAVEPVEQLALLALLTDDSDPSVAARAWETWRALPLAMVADVLGHPGTPGPLRDWIATHAGAADTAADVPAPTPAGAEDEPPPESLPSAPGDDDVAGETLELAADEDEAIQQLSSLPVPARIKMAMLGTREQRNILVRDPNRVVSTAVLSSPKLSETEVENFARMTNVSADVLRIIGSSRTWLRNYGVVSALVRNPRTPPAISLGLVPRLLERELRNLAVDRNVPEALRLTSRKALLAKESRRS